MPELCVGLYLWRIGMYFALFLLNLISVLHGTLLTVGILVL